MEKQKILIVDDDIDLSGSLKVILEHAGYDAATAASRAEGMEKIRMEQPNLIILDVMMETWQDGFEMSRDLKGDPQFKGTPILMLTSIEEITGIEVKSSAGDPVWLPVDGFLDKPVLPDTLLTEVRKLLQDPKVGAVPRRQ
ncbi:MAG: response regulator [Planctomycetaceae bacterium]|nr:MAG: response regulator [Planctomycetaceae bacterium]